MMRYRLVRLIETRSHELANELLLRVRESPQLPSFYKVSDAEITQRAHEVYGHLGQWLISSTEADIERHYREIGKRRYRQGVPLSELMWAITLTKETLWNFLNRESWPGFEVEVLAEHEMFRMIDRFFNHAVYQAAVGFEQAALEKQTEEKDAQHSHVAGMNR